MILYIKPDKKSARMTDEEYIEFVKKNENRSLRDIKPEELRETIIKAFASINSNIRHG